MSVQPRLLIGGVSSSTRRIRRPRMRSGSTITTTPERSSAQRLLMLSRICCRLFGRMVRLSFWPLSHPRLFMKKSPLPGTCDGKPGLEELHVTDDDELACPACPGPAPGP